MKIVVLTDDVLKEELLTGAFTDDLSIEYMDEPVTVEGAECYIDLLFEPTAERMNKLKMLPSAVIIINSVCTPLNDLPSHFVRINGWPTFLKRPIAEVSCNSEEVTNKTERILSCFGKKAEWVPDIPGFVTARVVSTIINEAYFALEEKVSSKEEIDTAMRLGTNYPFGPFEWAQLIGLRKIDRLLSVLAETNPRYSPALLLKQEALIS